MPVLLKASGKTTTDHIAPGGPWVRLRGHIGKSAASMLLRGMNAYTGEAGMTYNALTGTSRESVPDVARDYKTKNVRWVIIGDANYGEGSSREHAALYPRFLGGAAIIARSFARIHESNLKKQGLLALTFRNPADYDRIRERDRISIGRLKLMKEGKPVECRIAHDDGTVETLALEHSFTTAQLEWFRAGSALNLCRGQPVRRAKTNIRRRKNKATRSVARAKTVARRASRR